MFYGRKTNKKKSHDNHRTWWIIDLKFRRNFKWKFNDRIFFPLRSNRIWLISFFSYLIHSCARLKYIFCYFSIFYGNFDKSVSFFSTWIFRNVRMFKWITSHVDIAKKNRKSCSNVILILNSVKTYLRFSISSWKKNLLACRYFWIGKTV